MVGYNNERQCTTEISFLTNESQTMMTFVSKVQQQGLIILGLYIYPEMEVFQKHMKRLLEGLDGVGVEVIMDDILVWGTSNVQHEERLIRC